MERVWDPDSDHVQRRTYILCRLPYKFINIKLLNLRDVKESEKTTTMTTRRTDATSLSLSLFTLERVITENENYNFLLKQSQYI